MMVMKKIIGLLVTALAIHFSNAQEISSPSSELRIYDIIDAVSAELKPIREQAENLSEHPEEVRRIIEDGNEAAREVARDTLEEVRAAMGLGYK